jgi:hypothetical protein
MEQSWIVASGRLSVFLFYALIVASLLGIAYRRALRGSETRSAGPDDKGGRPAGALARLALEYVGNVGPEELRGRTERRRNREARVLMDYIKGNLALSEAQPLDAERLVEELRKTLRAERQEQTG